MTANVGCWNRKIHYYVGLAMLPFLWLFALSGVLLNPPDWNLLGSSNSSEERTIQTPAGQDHTALAQDVMRQLELVGEIEWTGGQSDAERLQFQVVRPGTTISVGADLIGKLATVRTVQTNSWLVVQILHMFPSVRENGPRSDIDWMATKLWMVAIDGLAIGLIVMVFSSYYMWFQLKPKRRIRMVTLTLGAASCGFFVWGLVWLGSLL